MPKPDPFIAKRRILEPLANIRFSRLPRIAAFEYDLSDETDQLSEHLLGQNRWLAQRCGILAFLERICEGGRIDIYDQAEQLVGELKPYAEAMGWAEYLDRVMVIIKKEVASAGRSTGISWGCRMASRLRKLCEGWWIRRLARLAQPLGDSESACLVFGRKLPFKSAAFRREEFGSLDLNDNAPSPLRCIGNDHSASCPCALGAIHDWIGKCSLSGERCLS